MQPLQISPHEIFDAYKKQIGDLSHELLLAQVQISKMRSIIEEYERTEAAAASLKRVPPLSDAPVPAAPAAPSTDLSGGS